MDLNKSKKQRCQVLRNKKNEGDAVGVNEKDSQTPTKSETRPKKRRVDCLQESKDVPTFEEAEFNGEELNLETLLSLMEMMKTTYENRLRILKLEKRFHSKISQD